jgi:predicted nucleic-acid-binding Zn-ribbon protein
VPTTPQAGTWYIVVTCAKCASTIFLFRDLTEGKGSLDARYIVTCPRCKHEGQYQARHYLHTDGTS